ncbi:hypothetical protein [Bacillus horti]|uniref:Permease n=2 Tax=Caldalkalibacillus horti TaxID=77523 RepID=A0ABT9W176_9BACI|nr:hypothetical protein [Bacillus horti]
MGIGLICWWLYHPNKVDILTHFGSLLNILSLFIVLTFIHAVIRVGKFDLDLRQFVSSKTKNAGTLYVKTSLMTYIFTFFLNVASVSIVVQSTKSLLQSFSEKWRRKYYSKVVLRPYTMVLFWSPLEVTVAVVIDYTSQSYLLLLPVLLGVSFIFLIGDMWIQRTRYKGSELGEEPSKLSSRKKSYFGFLSAIALLVVSIVTVSTVLDVGLLLAITLVLFPFSLVWAWSLKRVKRFLKLSWSMNVKNLPNLRGLFSLFLSAGFFIEMLGFTELFDRISALLESVYIGYPLFLFYLLLALLIAVLAIFGLHSLVSISVLLPFLGTFMTSFPPGLALAVLSAAIGMILVSPFNVTPSVLAFQIQASPLYFLKYNLIYVLCFIVVNVLIGAYLLS